ncbi:hypothetical protein FNV43_RR14244 [Rhamnella rubrinervis]|uniref:TraB domain-containing protein n=1 Tax=Rhamnella rubrinervis TaxID=2594499 RepID=A0A8K0H2L2_9ROSA|nr:hypothetical protein FNV43_RR14244 [Rhamnella rubrinervis]
MSFPILRRFLNTVASNSKPIVLRRFQNTASSNSKPVELLRTTSSNSKPSVLRRFLSSTASNSKPNERRRFQIPKELERTVMALSCESSADGGVCDVYVVGTNHVSSESCREVKAVISKVKPEVANRLGVVPGNEFRVAYKEAMKYGGRVILGDRPIEEGIDGLSNIHEAMKITRRRTWWKMPLWHKIKLLCRLLYRAANLPSTKDLKKMLMDDDSILSKDLPTVTETIVDERDQYMSSELLRIAGQQSSVVAVVGKGHLKGIKKYWKQPVVVKDLMDIPPENPVFSAERILRYVGVVAAVAQILRYAGFPSF